MYGAITDNWPTIEPYFNETGSNCPSILPRQQQRELMDLGIQSVQALGFQQVPAMTCRVPCRMGLCSAIAVSTCNSEDWHARCALVQLCVGVEPSLWTLQ